MEYRTLGKTGLNVSILGFGASPLSSTFRPVDEADAIQTVHTALDLGINFIDVSPYYGLTKSETILGKALQGIPRERYYMATKVGRYGDSEFDFSAERVTRSVDESLQRMKIDHIDLIQCHDIEFGLLNQVIHETIPALRKVKEQGKVRFIGITGFPLKIFRTVTEQTDIDTILSYCHYSLNNTRLESLFPMLQERNIGIISASPVSMGLLTGRGAPDWHPASQPIRDCCAKAAEFCRECGTDISKIALQFAVANSNIHTTFVGTANPENIKKNVEWIESPPDEEILQGVMEILQPIQDEIWPSGLPENN